MAEHKIHEHHEHAAQHYEQAAKHHREAAKHHKAGNHEKAAHHARIAFGYYLEAAEHQSNSSVELRKEPPLFSNAYFTDRLTARRAGRGDRGQPRTPVFGDCKFFSASREPLR